MLTIPATFILHDYSVIRDETVELEFEPREAALIIVDMQNTYCSKGGLLELRGVDTTLAAAPIAALKSLAQGCRQLDIPVIYTLHTHRPKFVDMVAVRDEIQLYSEGPPMEQVESGRANLHFGAPVEGSWFQQVVDELKPEPSDVLITSKHVYSGFYQTDLELILRSMGRKILFFGGATTGICVESTIRDAFFRGFKCVLLSDCTFEKLDWLQRASETIVKMHLGYTSQANYLGAAINQYLEVGKGASNC